MKSQRAWTLWVSVLLILGMIGCAEKSKEAAKEQKAVVAKPGTLESASGKISGDQERVADEFDPAAEEQAIAVIEQLEGRWSTEPYSRMELLEALVAHGRSREADRQTRTRPEGKPVVAVILVESDLTDTGLESLKRLASLQQLLIDNTHISDVGLRHIKRLANLNMLTLSNTPITDDGLEELAGLTNLTMLGLKGTKVTDAGLVSLKGLSHLRWLCLNDTQVGDTGLAHLTELTGLETLELQRTQATDAGLLTLKGLTNLRELHVSGEQVTHSGIDELRKALPKARIPR